MQCILKSRDITETKVHIVKAVVFPVVIYRCESWTIKKAVRQRIDAFELWCWRLLRVPWTARRCQPVNPRGNQPWIFIGRVDAKAEAPVLWPTHWKRPWCWEGLRGGEVGDRGWDDWMASLTQRTWAWTNSGRWWRTGKPSVWQSMVSKRVRQDSVTEQQLIFQCRSQVPKHFWKRLS